MKKMREHYHQTETHAAGVGVLDLQRLLHHPRTPWSTTLDEVPQECRGVHLDCRISPENPYQPNSTHVMRGLRARGDELLPQQLEYSCNNPVSRAAARAVLASWVTQRSQRRGGTDDGGRNF